MKKNKFISSTLCLMILALTACNKVVSPNSKENEITGLEPTYIVECGSKFEDEMESITSTSGEVEYTFYTNEELTDKYYDIKFDGLVGSLSGGTVTDYWVKVSAGGGATGYDEVSKTAKITSKCGEGDIPNIPTDCITYKTVACKNCKAQIGAGALMENEDVTLVDLSNDTPVFNYGLDTGSIVKEKTSSEPFEVNDIRYAFYDDGNKITNFSLPKINFLAFTDRDVVLKFRSNNRPGWGEQFAVRFGTDEEASNLFDGKYEDGWNVNPNGVLILHYSSEDEVLTIRSAGRLEKQVEITDTEIIKGEKSIVIYAKGASRSILLYNGCIYLSHDHEWFENTVAPTDKIGYKIKQCQICHYSEPSTDLMTDDDIDLSALTAYGANANSHNGAGDEGNRGITTGFKWNNPNGNTSDMSISFPRINFALYNNVFFEFGTSTASWGGAVRLSINSQYDLVDLNGGVAGIYGAIKFVYNRATNTLDVTSKVSTGQVKNITVTDENIINGEASLTGVLTLDLYRSFYLNKIALNHEVHNIDSSLQPSKTVIGYKVGACSTCLEEVISDTPMTDDDINLAYGYGVGVEGITGFVGYHDNRILLSEGSNSTGWISMPRVNYSIYSSVTFNMPFKPLWGNLGFDADNYIGYLGEGAMDVYIYLTITKVGDEYHATISCPSKSKSVESIITNEDVLSGKESLKIYHEQGAYTALYLTGVNVVI